MQQLIQETVSAFEYRNRLNIKKGFYVPRNIFDEELLLNARDKMSSYDNLIFQNCRASMKEGFTLAKSGNLNALSEKFKEAEETICHFDISFPCKLLIATFYCSGLAYLRYKLSESKEAYLLTLQALLFDNYLIQECGFSVMEYHKVQQIRNLAHVEHKFGQKEESTRMIFALLKCFENRDEFPSIFHYNSLETLQGKYASFLLSKPQSIGKDNPFDHFEKFHTTSTIQFSTYHLQTLFSLNFSFLSSTLTSMLMEQCLMEFAYHLKGKNNTETKALFNEFSIFSNADLHPFKKHQTAYLMFAVKLYSFTGNQVEFLKSVKFFFEKAVCRPIWNSVISDFYLFCQNCNEIEDTIKNQILCLLDEKNKTHN